MMFYCNKCGACCRNLDKSPLYAELDSGNGTCKYLNGNLCSIYETRPLLCRVDESYNVFYREQIGYDEYCKLNYEACDLLRKLSQDEKTYRKK